jgi:FkbM family methyltransferase
LHKLPQLLRFPIIYSLFCRLGKKQNYEKILYLKSIKKGQTILDLGANRGFFSYLFAKLTGAQGQVHCFEPIPENLKSLKANVSMFPWVEIHPFAVGDKKGEAEMHYSKHELEKATLQPETTQRCDTTAKVNLITLDEYMAEVNSTPIHFVKCDVEGHELKALTGMSSILRVFHPQLSIEITVLGDERKNIFKFLLDNGYDQFQKIEKNFPFFDPESEIPNDSYFYLYATSTLVA